MRILLVIASLVACTAHPMPVAGPPTSGAPPAHQDVARPSENARPEVTATGRLLVDDDGTSFRLQPDTGGAPYVLAAPEHAGTTQQLGDLVGTRVRITGTLVEGNGALMLRPTSIVGEHAHSHAPHDGVVGMAGDRHLELVVTPSGEIRIYLLDAFMGALDARGVTGDVVIQTRDRAPRSAPLRPGAERGLLVVEGERRRAGDDDITATLTIGAEQVRMTLPFRPDAAHHGHDHHPH